MSDDIDDFALDLSLSMERSRKAWDDIRQMIVETHKLNFWRGMELSMRSIHPLEEHYHYGNGLSMHKDKIASIHKDDWARFVADVMEFHPGVVEEDAAQKEEIRLVDACSMAVDRPMGEELVDYDIIDKGQTYTNSESFYAGAEWVRSIYERLIKEGYLVRNTKP